MKIHTPFVLFFSLLTTLSCSSDSDNSIPETNEPTPTDKPNILLIIADDMGLDASPGYAIGSIKPNMKTLQSMITNGVTYNNVWSSPTCTPTRAGIITGKYGLKTGVTKVGDVLSTAETSLQQYINQTTNSAYSQAVIGKWHLSTDPNHPTALGVDYYAGLLTGAAKSYTDWSFTQNGQTTNETEYITTKLTNLAIDWVADQTKPWFLWLAYTAPHTPFHLPPSNLHSQGNLPSDQLSIDANPLPYYMASLEAMDAEIGNLLNSMTEEVRNNTIIIFVGDNGTPNQVVQEYNSNRAKGSIYQGGINVPMIISGKNVTRKNEKEEALIATTDLFSTIADITGSGISERNDSKSFKSTLSNSNSTIRSHVYAEAGSNTNGSDYSIRNATHKYILFEDGSEALYDLSDNPLENPNLLNANQLPLSTANNTIKEELINELNNILNN